MTVKECYSTRMRMSTSISLEGNNLSHINPKAYQLPLRFTLCLIEMFNAFANRADPDQVALIRAA